MAFDDKLQYYYKTTDEVKALPTEKNQECIKLNMTQLSAAVQQHAEKWIQKLGDILSASAMESLTSLNEELEVGEE